MARKKKTITVKAEYENPTPEKLPTTEEVIMNMKVEEVETIEEVEEVPQKKTEKQLKLEAFKTWWDALPNHYTLSDAQARELHNFWKELTGRSDYYVNCSVCTINHLKQIKKIAKNEGIIIK